MFSPVPKWKDGLQEDLDPEAVYEPFRRLLSEYLPMSLRELARRIDKDRTTVSKWKSGQLIPTLEQQEEVTQEVAEALREMQEQLERVEAVDEALRAVEDAHDAHQGTWDEETREALEEANQRVRELLGSRSRE